MKVKAYIRPYKDLEDAPVFVWYTHKTKYFAVPAKVVVSRTRWNKRKGEVTGDDLTNLIIGKVKFDLLECAKRVMLAGLEPFVKVVQEYYKSGILPSVGQTIESAPKHQKVNEIQPEPEFLHYLDLYLEHNKDHLAPGTIKQRKSFAKVFREFIDEKQYPVSFSGMDDYFYSAMAAYYLEEKDHYNNYFGSLVKRLKGFLKWCDEEMHIAINPSWRKFKIYTEEKEIVYLNYQELDKLYNHPWTGNERKVVDLFVLACDTGFRISDVLKSRMWRREGGFIYTTTQKTKGAAKVPETLRIAAILKRYNGDMRIVSEANANEQIKVCLREIGMTEEVTYLRYKLRKEFEFTKKKCELVTLHCGRRSFISNCFAKGFTEAEIMEMIGSKDAKVLKAYLKIESSALKDKMKRQVA